MGTQVSVSEDQQQLLGQKEESSKDGKIHKVNEIVRHQDQVFGLHYCSDPLEFRIELPLRKNTFFPHVNDCYWY